jgi:hypothetical protein
MVGRLTVKTHINTPSFDPLGGKIPLDFYSPEGDARRLREFFVIYRITTEC